MTNLSQHSFARVKYSRFPSALRSLRHRPVLFLSLSSVVLTRKASSFVTNRISSSIYRRPLSFAMPSHFGLRSRRRSATERTPLVGSGTQNDGIEWREVFRVTRPYMFPSTLKLRFVAVVTLVMIMLSKLLALVPPYAYKLAVDAFANNLLGGPPIIPYAAVFLYVGARLLADLTSALQSYCFNLVTSDCTNTFAIDIFAHLQRLSLAFHLQRKTGEVTRIVDRGTRSIQVLMSTLLTTLFPVYDILRQTILSFESIPNLIEQSVPSFIRNSNFSKAWYSDDCACHFDHSSCLLCVHHLGDAMEVRPNCSYARLCTCNSTHLLFLLHRFASPEQSSVVITLMLITSYLV